MFVTMVSTSSHALENTLYTSEINCCVHTYCHFDFNPHTQHTRASTQRPRCKITHVFIESTPVESNFPLPITSACSFNRTLWKAIGAQTGLEARAFMNEGNAYSTYWAPVLNILVQVRRESLCPLIKQDVSSIYIINLLLLIAGPKVGQKYRNTRRGPSCDRYVGK